MHACVCAHTQGHMLTSVPMEAEVNIKCLPLFSTLFCFVAQSGARQLIRLSWTGASVFTLGS